MTMIVTVENILKTEIIDGVPCVPRSISAAEGDDWDTYVATESFLKWPPMPKHKERRSTGRDARQ